MLQQNPSFKILWDANLNPMRHFVGAVARTLPGHTVEETLFLSLPCLPSFLPSLFSLVGPALLFSASNLPLSGLPLWRVRGEGGANEPDFEATSGIFRVLCWPSP